MHRGNFEEALKVYNFHKECNVQIDGNTLKFILSMLRKMKRFDEAIDLARDCEKRGIQLTVDHYCGLLESYAKLRRFQELWDEIESKSLPFSAVFESELIRVCSILGSNFRENIKIGKFIVI